MTGNVLPNIPDPTDYELAVRENETLAAEVARQRVVVEAAKALFVTKTFSLAMWDLEVALAALAANPQAVPAPAEMGKPG